MELAGRIELADLTRTRGALYQLSYASLLCLEPAGGIEPPSSDYKTDAAATELSGRYFWWT